MHRKLRNYLALVLLALVFVCSPTFAASKPTTGWEDSSSAVQNDIPFVTVGNHSGATAERAISEGPGLDHDDNGANSTYVIKLGPILSYYYSTGATTQQTAVNAILGFSSLASQDICYYNGTNWVRLGKGANGTFLGISGGALGYYSPAGSGTVTSVDVAGTAGGELTFSGGPVTGSGTITGAWANQTTNKVFAAPNGSTGTPTFRLLVAADIPNLAASKITSGNLAKSVSATEGVYNDQSNTYTGTTTQDFSASGTTLVVPIKSTPGSPVSGEIWNASGALMYRDGTAGANRTLVNTARTISTTSPLSGGGALSGDLTLTLGTVPESKGGTNADLSATNQGSVIYQSSSSTMAGLAPVANTILGFNSSANAPTTIGLPGINGGRLTLTSATPVTTSDVTGAGTLYWTPYKHGQISLYDGSNWQLITPGEKSLSLTLTSGSMYDVFGYLSSGTLALETLVWTNTTTRATALSTQDGVTIKSGAATRRYLGSIYASGTNTTEDSAAIRGVFNETNRERRIVLCKDGTDTWSQGSTSWRPFNNSSTYGTGRCGIVCGLPGMAVRATAHQTYSTGASSAPFIGIGIDSTTTASTAAVGSSWNGHSWFGIGTAEYAGTPAVGFHYLTPLEATEDADSVTFMGDNGTAFGGTTYGLQSGMVGEVWQ